MKPPLDRVAGLLPPGVHEASWEEIVERFGFTNHRLALLDGLYEALVALAGAGCGRVYVDGSFVTAKEIPGDFDVCWEPQDVNLAILRATAPLLFDLRNRRAAQKVRYGGKFFAADWPADSRGTPYREFFQQVKGGGRKGIIAIDPSTVA